MFPWRDYTDAELIQEFLKLRTYMLKKSDLTRSNIGYACSNAFFQYERLDTVAGDHRATEDWERNKARIKETAKKLGKDFFGTIVYRSHPSSQFPPSIAGKIYLRFGATHVFDPYAGWGDRCLAAMALDIDYTGADSNTNLKDSYKDMIDFYQPLSESNVKMFFRPCERLLTRTKGGKCPLEKVPFDFVFSSPPFWKNGRLYEEYDKCETDYIIFLETSLFPIMGECLKKGVYVALYLPEDMAKDVKKKFGPCVSTFSFGNNRSCRRSTDDKIYCW